MALHTALTFFACVALAFVLERVSQRLSKGTLAVRVGFCVMVLAWLGLAWVVGVTRGENAFTAEANVKSIERSHDAPEYRLSELARLIPEASEPLAFEKVTSEIAIDYLINQWTENTIEVTAPLKAGDEVHFARQYFGDWRVSDSAESLNHETGAVRKKQGLLTFTPNRISLVALIVVALLLLVTRNQQMTSGKPVKSG